MNDSDDDSSDSSNDFAGITPKDELTASFFSIKPATRPNLVQHDSEDESSDDDESFACVPENNDIELFSEVVKNLEATQRTCADDGEPRQHFSKDEEGSTQDGEGRAERRRRNISDEINAVLLQGEGGARAFREDEDTDGEQEQEEDAKRPEDYTIPKEGVRITLPGTSMIFKKKPGSKRESDLAALLRRKLKANQIIVEKAARLCWLAYGFHLNHQANDPEVMATAVSLVSIKNYPKDSFNLEYLAKFTKWFKNIFTIESSDNEVVINKETLLKRIAEKKIYNYRELVILYVAVLRGIGLHCRLVVSLNPPLVKTYNELLPKTSTTKKDSKIKEETKEAKTKVTSKEDKKNVNSKKDLKNNSVIQNNETARRNANIEAKKRAAEILRLKYSYNKTNKDKSNSNIFPQDNASTSKSVETASTNSKKIETGPSSRRLRSGKVHDVACTSTEQQNTTKIISENNQPKMRNSKRHSRSDSTSSEDEEPSGKSKRKCNNKSKPVIKSKGKNEKEDQASAEDEDIDNKLKKRRDVWAEVYVESKASWICINVMDENVDCVTEIYVSNIRK